MASLLERTGVENAILSQLGLSPSPSILASRDLPRYYWVSTAAGSDGVGNGGFATPFATIRRAIRESVDARGDTILVAPGSYAENIDIGSGNTTSGSSGSYQKRNLKIIGVGGGHNGIVQIVGDGSSASATLRVQAGYLTGFVLKNIELDANSAADTGTTAQTALHLVSNDTGASPVASASNYRFEIENVAVRSDDPDVGFLFQGATLGLVRKCWIESPVIGMAFTGSASNNPSDLEFEDIDFRNCVTADIATVTGVESSGARTTIVGIYMQNVSFHRPRHWDRGGTPVTNYVNFPNPVASMINVHFFDGYAARDVADETLLSLPANVVWIGKSAAAAEFIIGA